MQVLRQVAQGHYVVGDQVFDHEGLQAWMEKGVEKAGRSHMTESREAFSPLSPREMEILQYVTQGLSNKEIAYSLGISHQTVKNHMTAILHKLMWKTDPGRRVRCGTAGCSADPKDHAKGPSIPWAPSPQELVEQTQTELEQTERDLKEIRMMVTQSRSEVEKLTQRNTQVTTHLRQIQSQFDTIPRPDIKAAYEAASDAQQRLFTMRGQLEKLQSDQANLQRLADHLQKTLTALQGSQGGMSGGAGAGSADAKPMIVRVVEAQSRASAFSVPTAPRRRSRTSFCRQRLRHGCLTRMPSWPGPSWRTCARRPRPRSRKSATSSLISVR
jgi:predicted transcriptional regulator